MTNKRYKKIWEIIYFQDKLFSNKQYTATALNAITPTIKFLLMYVYKCSESTINRYIRENDDKLTRIVAIQIMMWATGLSLEQILEDR